MIQEGNLIDGCWHVMVVEVDVGGTLEDIVFL